MSHPDNCSNFDNALRSPLVVKREMVVLPFVFNDRFYLSFFVATYGFRESD